MIAGQAAADIDIDAATHLYQNHCQICHDDHQLANSAIPQLAGQQASYLTKSLRDYQQSRFDPIMTPLANHLSPADRDNLAAYLSHQPITQGNTQKIYLAQGQKLYRAGDLERHIPACSACHGPTGMGNAEAQYPRLAGQHSAYLIKQLQLFAQDQRQSDPNAMMRDIAKRLNTQDQVTVASFIQGLATP